MNKTHGEGIDGSTPIVDDTTGEEVGRAFGLEEFSKRWQQNTDVPELMKFSGWQMSDADHPAGDGTPAYRLVHKTIRMIPFPAIVVDLGDILLRIKNGEVTTGKPVYEHALPWRREGEFINPEWGRLDTQIHDKINYVGSESHHIHARAHQETLPSGNYVEILCKLSAVAQDDYHDQLSEGRARVAAITAAMDLEFGPRLLGPILTEEIGNVFDDWHWNRRLDGASIGVESQTRIEQFHFESFHKKFEPIIRRLSTDNEEHYQRCRIASQWYWRAEREPDRVVQFISYWLIVEALELDENANINPIKESVAKLLNVTKNEISGQIGRLYGKRNRLLHGKQRYIDQDALRQVRILAGVLLEEHLLGLVSGLRLQELRTVVFQDV